MFCSRCGASISENSKFCSNCGVSVWRPQQPNIIRLRCEKCDGAMDVDESREVISCPYCGSKKLIIENDAVKIEKIKSNSRFERRKIDRDIEQIRADRDIKIARSKKDPESQKAKYTAIIIALLVLLYIFY